MPHPRVRSTVRRMIAVAIVAVLIAYARGRFLSRMYFDRYLSHYQLKYKEEAEGNIRRAAYHDSLSEKYWYAARCPFLPVAPDPPEPE